MKKLLFTVIFGVALLSAGCMMNQQGPSFEQTPEGLGWDFGDRLTLGARFSTSPVHVDDKIFMASLDGTIYAFDYEKGKKIDPKVWNFKLPQGIRSTPVHRDGLLYFGAFDKNIYGIDISNGSTRVKFETGGYVSATPLIVGSMLFIGSYDGYFRAIDLTSNRETWKFNAESKIRGGASAYNAGVIFCSENGVLFNLNQSDGAIIWSQDVGSEVYGAPVVADELIITADLKGKIKAFDSVSGYPQWEFNPPKPEHPYSEEFWVSPLVHEDTLYVGSSYGKFYALKTHPSTNSGEMAWNAPFETTNGGENRYEIMSEASIKDDKILFGSNGGKLYCLNRFDGSEIWSFPTYEEIRCKPLITEKGVIFMSNDNYLYGLNIEDKSPIRGN